MAGEIGIEPMCHESKSCELPLFYSPKKEECGKKKSYSSLIVCRLNAKDDVEKEFT